MTAEVVDTKTGEIISGTDRELELLAEKAQRSVEVIREARQIVAMLEHGPEIDEITRLANRAEALRMLAKKAGLAREVQNGASYAGLRAIRAGGKLLPEIIRKPEEGRPKEASHDGTLTLDDLGLTRNQSSRWQKIAGVPDDAFEEYVAHVNSQDEELTQAGVRGVANRIAGGKGVVQSVTNEWYTPSRYLDAARAVLGSIDLDPASCDEANETVKAARFYSADDDGLLLDWSGTVWLNPPYGRIAGSFVERLVDRYTSGDVFAAIALVNAHCTDARWFQPLWDHTLCFTDHRIDFAAGTADRSGSTHGSVFVYLGPDPSGFATEFAGFGAVVRRYE